MITWADLVETVNQELSSRGLNGEYQNRLKFELAEAEKQGTEAVWVNRVNDGKKFASNPNNLVLPWLLGMVAEDPIATRTTPILNTARASKVLEFKNEHGYIPHDLIKDADSPDIDLDCLPTARDPIKEYAIQRYGQNFGDGYGSVCSVGTWQTYKFKSAIVDTAVALGLMDVYSAQQYTTQLPDEVDELKEGGKAVCKGRTLIEGDDGTRKEKECKTSHSGLKCPKCGSADTDGPTIDKIMAEQPILVTLRSKYPQVLDAAVNLIGRVRNMGMHAGAIIITNQPLYGNIPLSRSSNKGYWTSMWTEGRNTQLSKFGYIKWDILGLKTLQYIFNCCKLIEENRGISFGKNMSGWDDIVPQERRAGHFFDADGKKRYVDLDDKYALALANEQKTDGVFQFDTDLAKSILANGVRTFEDLLLFNAMGHPGPMASIPEAVKNRDDSRGSWKKRLHPEFLAVLESTYGVIVFQEQLQALWQNIAGFTSPEAQEARKAVAKKWVDKLAPVEKKWIDGAGRKIGVEDAKEWWSKMVTFGRYAFNLSHAVSYCLVAHRCLWLKAHFAPEWWASVMSGCHPDKLVRYMGVARAEGWKPTEISYCGRFKGDGVKVHGVSFATINIERLTTDFTATGDRVNQGLIGIKGIGKKAAKVFQGRGVFANIDEFVAQEGRRSKTVMERFIKLDAFKHMPGHENTYALWMWYQYKYCKSGKEMTLLRKEVRQKLLELEGWTELSIKQEINRQIAAYKAKFPKRSKIPPKFGNWRPKPNDSREKVMSLFSDKDFTLTEKLNFQKTFLGYWIDSPLELYNCTGTGTVTAAKNAAKGQGRNFTVLLEGIIVETAAAETKKGAPYLKVFITDGIQRCLVFIWSNELAFQDFNVIKEGAGVSMVVTYDEARSTFALARGETVNKLKPRQ